RRGRPRPGEAAPHHRAQPGAARSRAAPAADERAGGRRRQPLHRARRDGRRQQPAPHPLHRRGFPAHVGAVHPAGGAAVAAATAPVARSSAQPDRRGIVPITAIAAGVRNRSGAAAALRVRLTGEAVHDIDLTSERQRLTGDTLTVQTDRPTALMAAYRLPATDTALAAYLRPEPLLQSTNPRIEAQARLLSGRGRDPTATATALVHWVATTVRDEPGALLP